MKVLYKKCAPEYPGQGQHYDLVTDFEWCCEGMREAYNRAITFGEVEDFGCGHKLTVSHCHPFPEGAVWDSYEIDFCPFCGEKIDTLEVTA